MFPVLSLDFMDWYINLLRLPQLLVELWVPDQGYRQSVGSHTVAITVGVQVENSSSNPMGI